MAQANKANRQSPAAENLMDKDAFIVAVVTLWREHNCMDIDGCSFQDLLVKHGLASEGPATEEDCETAWAREYGVEAGDLILHDHPNLAELMKGNQK